MRRRVERGWVDEEEEEEEEGVVEGEVNRTYTFTIHHRRIDMMEPAEREALAEQLRKLAETFKTASPEDECAFQYDFLIL